MKTYQARTILLSLTLLAACSPSTPQSSTTPLPPPTISSSPSISTSESPPGPEMLCLNLLPSAAEWPVEQSIQLWNQNGDGFKFTYKGNCFNTVRVQALDAGSLWWGETRIVEKLVTFNVSAPYELRQHITCHELGHLMGIGHTDDPDSCMNIGLTITHPSARDLELAGKNTWLFGE